MKRKKLMLVSIIVCIFIGLSLLAILNSSSNIYKYDNIEKKYSNINSQIEQNENVKQIFLNVLDNKENFIGEDNKKININEYVNKIAGTERKLSLSYAFLDMDGDELNEMVAKFEGFNEYYLILNYENDEVYGFEENERGITSLKNNGLYWKSEENNKGSLVTSKFSKNIRKNLILAQIDGEVYKVQEERVDFEKFNQYLKEEFYSKENAEWKKYKDLTTSKKNGEFQEGNYLYESPNGQQIQTLTIKNNNIEWKNEFLGITRTGTFTINNNTLIATYTEESKFNLNTNQKEINEISHKIIYTIMEDGLYIQDNGVKLKFVKEN